MQSKENEGQRGKMRASATVFSSFYYFQDATLVWRIKDRLWGRGLYNVPCSWQQHMMFGVGHSFAVLKYLLINTHVELLSMLFSHFRCCFWLGNFILSIHRLRKKSKKQKRFDLVVQFSIECRIKEVLPWFCFHCFVIYPDKSHHLHAL